MYAIHAIALMLAGQAAAAAVPAVVTVYVTATATAIAHPPPHDYPTWILPSTTHEPVPFPKITYHGKPSTTKWVIPTEYNQPPTTSSKPSPPPPPPPAPSSATDLRPAVLGGFGAASTRHI